MTGPENQLTEFLRPLTVPYVVMGVGLPQTGKSGILRAMGRELDARVVSPYAVRRQLVQQGLSDLEVTGLIWSTLHKNIGHSLEGGQPVLLDATNIDPVAPGEERERFSRPRLVARYREQGARAVAALVFDHPLEEALARGRFLKPSVIERLHANLTARPVTLREGFDVIAKQKGRGEPVEIVDWRR